MKCDEHGRGDVVRRDRNVEVKGVGIPADTTWRWELVVRQLPS